MLQMQVRSWAGGERAGMSNKNKPLLGRIRPEVILLLFLLIALAIVLVVAVISNNDTAPINNEQNDSFSADWLLENEGRVISLPYVFPTKGNDVVVISKTLSGIFENSNVSLSFISSLQTVHITVDDQIIYDYCEEADRYFEVQPPPAWHVVRLSSDMEGKTLRIAFSSPFDHYAGVLNSIQIGTKFANVSSFVGSRLLSLMLCFAIFVFGVFITIVYLFSRCKIPALDRFLYLGIASMLIALWSACETKAMQIFTGNVQLIMFITFLSIMLFPIALLLFFRESFRGKIRIGYNVFLSLFGGYFIVMVILQVFSIANFNDPFGFFLLALIAMLVWILGSTIYLHLGYKSAQSSIPVVAVSLLLVFSLIDLYRYFYGELRLTSDSDTSLFVRVGILLMIFTLGYGSVKQILQYYVTSTKASVYKAMSQTDGMTGLKNRVYLSEVYPKIFEHAIRNRQCFSVIMLDIDNFKSYNDHYGHSAGDLVIQSVSKTLQEAASRSLDGVIRYGGEEFLVLLPSSDRDGAVHVSKKIKQGIETLQMSHAYSAAASVITLSQGICSAVPVRGDTLDQFIDRADQALYKVKNTSKNSYAVYSGPEQPQ